MAQPLHAKKVFEGIMRPAQDGDLPEIVRIEKESFGKDQWPEWQLGESLQDSIDSPYTSLVMAFEKAASPGSNDNGKAAGYGLGQMDSRTQGHVMSMAVGNDFRGQGLGRLLLEKLEESFVKLGAKKIVLEVEATNTVAINLYESSGYKKDHVMKGYYGRKRDGFFMVKTVKP